MGLIYQATVYSHEFLQNGFYSASVSRASQEEAIHGVLALAYSSTIKVVAVERDPKFLRPLDYAVNATFIELKETRTQLVHIIKRWGTIDPLYLEVSNELIFGKQEV